MSILTLDVFWRNVPPLPYHPISQETSQASVARCCKISPYPQGTKEDLKLLQFFNIKTVTLSQLGGQSDQKSTKDLNLTWLENSLPKGWKTKHIKLHLCESLVYPWRTRLTRFPPPKDTH